MQCKGIVQGNVIILEEGVHLPNGVRVTVTVEQKEQAEEEVTQEELARRRALIAHMKAFGERLAGRHVELGQLIIENREELENRA